MSAEHPAASTSRDRAQAAGATVGRVLRGQWANPNRRAEAKEALRFLMAELHRLQNEVEDAR